MTASPEILRGLLEIDARLAARGVPELSDFWRGEVEAFYLHPTARSWVAQIGRGGAKTTQGIVKTAIAETLFGQFKIPIGERHYFAIVSANVDETAKTLRVVGSNLRMLGVSFDTRDDAIDLREDKSRGLKVLACRVGAVSGFRAFGWAADENAKWSNDGANPSAEVCASLRAMTITHPNARSRMFSSPLGRAGYHYEAWSKGTTGYQVASHAASWVANPSITEAYTREHEPDERVWKREYAAEPQATASAAFDQDAVDRAFVPRAELIPRRRVMVIDASSGRKDTWAWGAVGWNRDERGHGYVHFDNVDGIEGRFWRTTSAREVVDRVAAACEARGITEVHGDQREAFALSALFEEKGLRFRAHDWTATSKPRAVETVRRWLADGLISFCEHAKLRRELLEFEEKITSAGTFRYEARGGGKDDYVALVVTAAMVELAGDLDSAESFDLDDEYDEYLPRSRYGGLSVDSSDPWGKSRER